MDKSFLEKVSVVVYVGRLRPAFTVFLSFFWKSSFYFYSGYGGFWRWGNLREGHPAEP